MAEGDGEEHLDDLGQVDQEGAGLRLREPDVGVPATLPLTLALPHIPEMRHQLQRLQGGLLPCLQMTSCCSTGCDACDGAGILKGVGHALKGCTGKINSLASHAQPLQTHRLLADANVARSGCWLCDIQPGLLHHWS